MILKIVHRDNYGKRREVDTYLILEDPNSILKDHNLILKDSYSILRESYSHALHSKTKHILSPYFAYVPQFNRHKVYMQKHFFTHGRF